MTQEDKELLLQDLCARLPYGVKISIPELFTNKETVETLNGIFKGDDGLYRVNDSGMLIKYVKPYLFPLSSMTEEHSIYMEKNKLIIASSETEIIMNSDGYDFLNKNHYDYRGLIEKGLAIDATGLNIY